jgi:hypothetical protein
MWSPTVPVCLLREWPLALSVQNEKERIMSDSTMDQAKVNLVNYVSLRLAESQRGTLTDDIGRIVAIAAQLFAAIERQTHLIEEELVIACGEQARPFAQSAFNDRLRTCAMGLDASLHEIAINLKQRAVESSNA